MKISLNDLAILPLVGNLMSRLSDPTKPLSFSALESVILDPTLPAETLSPILKRLEDDQRVRAFLSTPVPPDTLALVNEAAVHMPDMGPLNPYRPHLLLTIMYYESGYRTAAVNESSGAAGLIQIMPSTAKVLQEKYKLPPFAEDTQPQYVAAYLDDVKGSLPGVPLPPILNMVRTPWLRIIFQLISAHRAGLGTYWESNLNYLPDIILRIRSFLALVLERRAVDATPVGQQS